MDKLHSVCGEGADTVLPTRLEAAATSGGGRRYAEQRSRRAEAVQRTTDRGGRRQATGQPGASTDGRRRMYVMRWNGGHEGRPARHQRTQGPPRADSGHPRQVERGPLRAQTQLGSSAPARKSQREPGRRACHGGGPRWAGLRCPCRGRCSQCSTGQMRRHRARVPWGCRRRRRRHRADCCSQSPGWCEGQEPGSPSACRVARPEGCSH